MSLATILKNILGWKKMIALFSSPEGVRRGYYKFSEFKAIKATKFFKALNFLTAFQGGCKNSESLSSRKWL